MKNNQITVEMDRELIFRLKTYLNKNKSTRRKKTPVVMNKRGNTL